MSSSNNFEIISKASAHTIKKFELVEKYIKGWAHKLLQFPKCEGIIYIDCMCNSGMYHDGSAEIEGTALRVAKILKEASIRYPGKKVYVFFNDKSQSKIEFLKSRLPASTNNFRIKVYNEDGNSLLIKLGTKLEWCNRNNLHFFLFYDPYDASIDWNALLPFFRYWGEVLINHMVSDPVRAISQVKSDQAKRKYMDTYLVNSVEQLIPYGHNKQAYEDRVKEIISRLKGGSSRKYYIASYPFFNSRNSLLYDLIHCTSNEIGFNLYKTTAWKTFGDCSSLKNRHGNEFQLTFDALNNGSITTEVDEYCYNLYDVALYLHNIFSGMGDIPKSEIQEVLSKHPVFPNQGYQRQIASILKKEYGVQEKRNSLIFK